MTTTASWYHCSVKTVGRAQGRSVVAAAAYRLGERMHDDRYDQTHDFTRKGGVMERFTFAPADAPGWAHEPEHLWNAAEAAEKRINSRVAREVELALPAFLSNDDRLHIVERFAAELVNRYGVAVSVGIHEPGKGDSRNYHAHILFTTREIGVDGFGQKTRILDAAKSGPEEVKKLRALAADLINEKLIAVNSDTRVDHRSFKDRGIEQEPTTHLGPTASAMERKGERSDRGDINREAKRVNAEQNAAIEERNALDAAIAAAERDEGTAEKPAPSDLEISFTPADKRALREFAEEATEALTRSMQQHHQPGMSQDDAADNDQPPHDLAEGRQRVRADMAPFTTAIRQRGVVADMQSGDGLPWWQRVGLRIAEIALMVGRGFPERAMSLWHEQTSGAQQREMQRDLHDRGRER